MSDLNNPASQADKNSELNQRVRQEDRDHVFHSWSAQGHINPLPIAGGQGSVMWDYEGNEYLDFSSQLVNLNLGHKHPKLVQSIIDQAQKLPTIQPSMANETRGQAAKLITDAAPEGMNHVFFTNGGAEAVENAVRMARQYTGRPKVMSFYRSYHGATSTAISLTGDPRRWKNEPSDSSVVHFFGPYLYRSLFHATTEAEECQRALEHFEQVVILEGASTIAAVIIESVVGSAGVIVPPKGYLAGVKAICEKHGICYIADEVMVGFGRTGTMFGFENFDVTPDLITFAKGVNSGYVPLGGVIIADKIYQKFVDEPFPGGLTYSGHPLACAPAVATFEVFAEEKILERVKDLGERVIRPKLEAIKAKHKSVGEVRGIGLFWAIELVKNQETREGLVPYAASAAQSKPMLETIAECKKNGVLPFQQFNRMHIAPPLNIKEEDLIRGLEAIDQALSIADSYT